MKGRFQDSGQQKESLPKTHNFSGRILYWPYCVHCGLVLLKNERSLKAANRKCIDMDDNAK